MSDRVESVKEQLTVLKIDEVIQELRYGTTKLLLNRPNAWTQDGAIN